MGIIKRGKAPTPIFFRKLRNAGIAVAAVSGVLLTAPVALPAVLVKLAGYLALAGGIASAIGQAVTDDRAKQ